MAEIDVKAIRARADTATPGPWIHRYYQRITTSDDTDGSKSIAHVYDKNLGNFSANIDFIAHARTDIPALCDAYEAQAKEIERLDGMWVAAEKDHSAALEEIERLREHIKLHAGDTLSLDNEITTIREQHDAEIERLKGLLREADKFAEQFERYGPEKDCDCEECRISNAATALSTKIAEELGS